MKKKLITQAKLKDDLYFQSSHGKQHSSPPTKKPRKTPEDMFFQYLKTIL